ncbi:MAG: hypothetical protein M1831_004448 [Alyxoria varia]|nr:MAG: hypothetical protein M1831_004448 [Alyxoria varia]
MDNMAPIVPVEDSVQASTENSLNDDSDSAPRPAPLFPTPLFRLHVDDLSHKGATRFLSSVEPQQCLENAMKVVLSLLYHKPTSGVRDSWPGVRSVTLVLADVDGVAYTTGKSIDQDHKIIKLSLDYVSNISPHLLTTELMGVITHEMVHCWQHNALGTAPGGLIEGIADFVRLRAHLAPPHWKRDGDGNWDEGYQHTGYFLDWLERKFGDGSVKRVNEMLKNSKYNEDKFWPRIFGFKVSQLWERYKKEEFNATKGGEVEDERTAGEKE